ncbi:MAG: flagellar protein FlaG [Spirochaetales bacterium]|nr:flagellar protein FlaG [Spirochaetales bacterium]
MSIEIPLNIIAGSSQDKQYTDKIVLPSRPNVVKENDAGNSLWTESDLRKMLDTLEKEIRMANRRLKFNVNKEINRIIVKVIDGETNEVIREIPEVEIQKLIARIKETIGILFDKKI